MNKFENITAPSQAQHVELEEKIALRSSAIVAEHTRLQDPEVMLVTQCERINGISKKFKDTSRDVGPDTDDYSPAANIAFPNSNKRWSILSKSKGTRNYFSTWLTLPGNTEGAVAQVQLVQKYLFPPDGFPAVSSDITELAGATIRVRLKDPASGVTTEAEPTVGFTILPKPDIYSHTDSAPIKPDHEKWSGVVELIDWLETVQPGTGDPG